MTEPGIVIVGGDSRIGAAAARRLRTDGAAVTVTSRRDTAAIRLDLAAPAETWPALPEGGAWVVAAAIASLARCRDEPALARRVNAEAVEHLARQAERRGAFLVLLSTNQVFDGTRPHRADGDPPCPITEYGRTKADAEAAILALGPSGAIVRLTKVLAPDEALMQGWMADLRQGRPIHPAADMVLAPVAQAVAAQAIGRVARERLAGIIQVSATRDISYAAAAAVIAAEMKADATLVRPRSATELGLSLEFQPRWTSLDTTGFAARLGMVASAPDQPLRALVHHQSTIEQGP